MSAIDVSKFELANCVVNDGRVRVRKGLFSHKTPTVGSVYVGPISMFDPDVYVIDGSMARDPDSAIPASAVKLVVEVS